MRSRPDRTEKGPPWPARRPSTPPLPPPHPGEPSTGGGSSSTISEIGIKFQAALATGVDIVLIGSILTAGATSTWLIVSVWLLSLAIPPLFVAFIGLAVIEHRETLNGEILDRRPVSVPTVLGQFLTGFGLLALLGHFSAWLILWVPVAGVVSLLAIAPYVGPYVEPMMAYLRDPSSLE